MQRTPAVFLSLLFIISSQVSQKVYATPPTESWGTWEQARTLYDSGKYQEALDALRANPGQDANYYYNVGNIHYRLGQLGLAVAYLEKANHSRAHDSDIQHNLKIARDALGRVLGPERIDPASTSIETLADHAPIDEIRTTLGILALVVTLFWLLTYSKRRNLRQTLLHPAGLVGLIAILLSLGFFGVQRIAASRPPAFCIEQQAVRSGPGDQFSELARLEPGQKIRQLGPIAQTGQEQWKQIRYAADSIGWIRASSLLPL